MPFANGGGGGGMFGGGGGAAAVAPGGGGGAEGWNEGADGADPKDGGENEEADPIGLLNEEVVEGVDGEGVVGLVAASIAFIFASLSPLSANIIPDKIPVRKVEIGTSISKNFWSMGEIAFKGCVTKIME